MCLVKDLLEIFEKEGLHCIPIAAERSREISTQMLTSFGPTWPSIVTVKGPSE